MMSTSNVAFVGSIPENYDRYLGPVLFDPYAADLLTRLAVLETGSVLELACGTGILTRRLREELYDNVRLVATDLNDPMLAYARQKFENIDGIEWRQADATELPFADGSFDAVVCQFGLMFFPDKARAVGEVFRVLKPGRSFLFSVWDRIELNDLPRLAHEVVSNFFEDNPPDFYNVPFSFHDRATIRALLVAAGFTDNQFVLQPLAAIASSAREVARGMIHGNPIIAAIKERDESRIPEIEATLTAAIISRHGDAPVRAHMQALICTATR